MHDTGDLLCYPEFPNISCIKPPLHVGFWFYKMAIFSISVPTMVLNLFVIISVSHFRQLHTPTNILLLSLAASDFLTGLVMIIDGRQIFSCWFWGVLFCAFFRYVSCVLLVVAIGNMALISVDRYVAICHPLHYTTRFTVKRVKVSVCLLWFYGSIFFFRAFLVHIIKLYYFPKCIGYCPTFKSYIGQMIQLVLNMFLPITIIIVLYMRVFIVAVSQARAMRSHITDVTKQISVSKTAKKSELKAARTLGVVVIVFLICLLPSYITTPYTSRVSDQYWMFLHFMTNFNSCVNPLIYALFYSWFRKAVKLIVSLQILQPGSSEANVL